MNAVNEFDILSLNTSLSNHDINICHVTTKDVGNALLSYFQGNKSKWIDIENSEILVIKDTDYLIGKTTTQEEFIKLIQTRRKNGTHTIIEVNCSLKELPILSECLSKHFKSFLVSNIGFDQIDK